MKVKPIPPQGFLLLESLIVLSLLTVGLLAFAEAFSQSRTALIRSQRRNALVDCAQERLLSEWLRTPVPIGLCDSCSIRVDRAPVSRSLGRIWVATRFTDDSISREETLEAIEPVQ